MPTTLQDEIRQRKPFGSTEEEALLSIARTAAVLDHAAGEVLKQHGLTPTQYNALRILRGEDDSLKPRQTCRGGAHRAWLERNPQGAFIQPRSAKGFGGTADCDDLRMSGRVVRSAHEVPRLGKNGIAARDDGPNRHLALPGRQCGKIERAAHRRRQWNGGHSAGLAPGRKTVTIAGCWSEPGCWRAAPARSPTPSAPGR